MYKIYRKITFTRDKYNSCFYTKEFGNFKIVSGKFWF